MPPIAIGGFPEGNANSEKEVIKQRDLLSDILTVFNAELGAPDDDREFRVVNTGVEPGQIKIAFGTSDTTYIAERPDNPSFWPSSEEIDAAGTKIVDMIKKSDSGVSELIIESWVDATFRMYERQEIESTELKEPEGLITSPIEKFVNNPVMEIVVSSSAESIKQAGGNIAEFENGFSTEFQEKLNDISPNAKSFFENMRVVAKVVALGEVDFSIEFDGDIKDINNKIPAEIRKYAANAALRVLNQIKPDCTGEIWVRQGQPNTTKTYPIK